MSCCQIRALADHEVRGTLANELVPIADCLRQLMTDFGLRPYRVLLVWVAWSADENRDGWVRGSELSVDDRARGAGAPTLVFEHEILPTPVVGPFTSTRKDVLSTGNTEDGTITVKQISASYSEDALMGLLPRFRDPQYPESLQKGISFFWEIRENRPARYSDPETKGGTLPTDLPAIRRRYAPNSVGDLKRDAFQWTVTLTRADGERDRFGALDAMR